MTNPSAHRSTSLFLIVLTLLVGIGVGWLVHDLFDGAIDSLPLSAARPSPSTVMLSPTVTSRTPEVDVALPTHLSTLTPLSLPSTGPSATATPLPQPPPSTITWPSLAPQIVAYAGYVVSGEETLYTIAEQGGSLPDLITSYNRIRQAVRPGQSLIVPQLRGRSSTIQSVPLLVRRGPDTNPWVALTLDAGAGADPVPQMLEALRERNIQITFFLTGAWIEKYPELTQQIVDDGHEIANHSFNHPDFTQLSDEEIRAELADTEAIMQRIAGTTTRPFFRPPFGAYDERVLQLTVDEGYLPVYWTLDSLDSIGELKSPQFLLERVTGYLSPEELRGAIILAHCGSEATALALPDILDRFVEMGFEVKKLSEVLGS